MRALRSWPAPLVAAGAIAVLAFGAMNAIGLAQTFLWLIRHGGEGGDWSNLVAASPAEPYAVGGYRWSPAAAWLWLAVVAPLGLHLWQLLHLVILALVRDWRIIGLALLSWAFWQDLANGNVLTLVLVLAWWALRGSSLAIVGFVVLSVLVPRPLMIPVLVVLLIERPWARWALLGATVIVVGQALAVGQLDEWLQRMLVTGQSELASPWNIGPSRLLGPIWIPIGAALAAAFAWKGWVGTASVVISPYLFPYYLLMALLDVPRLVGRTRIRAS
jgi:hypothetical protein